MKITDTVPHQTTTTPTGPATGPAPVDPSARERARQRLSQLTGIPPAISDWLRNPMKPAQPPSPRSVAEARAWQEADRAVRQQYPKGVPLELAFDDGTPALSRKGG